MHCTVLQKQVSERRAQQQLYSNCFRRPIRATQLLVLCSRPPCLARPPRPPLALFGSRAFFLRIVCALAAGYNVLLYGRSYRRPD